MVPRKSVGATNKVKLLQLTDAVTSYLRHFTPAMLSDLLLHNSTIERHYNYTAIE